MKVISFRDLKKADQLSQYRELDLLHPSMDELVYSVLESIGFDTEYAIQYYPANHRDMSGNVGMGFLAAGEINISRKHINAVYTDTITRIAASSYTDRSLTQELAQMMSNTLDFNSFNEPGDTDEGTHSVDEYQDGWQDVSAQIKQLEDIRDSVRGDPYGADGSYKTKAEVAEWYRQSLTEVE